MSLHIAIHHHIPEHVEFYECDMMEYDRGDTNEPDLLHIYTHKVWTKISYKVLSQNTVAKFMDFLS